MQVSVGLNGKRRPQVCRHPIGRHRMALAARMVATCHPVRPDPALESTPHTRRPDARWILAPPGVTRAPLEEMASLLESAEPSKACVMLKRSRLVSH